MHRRGGLTREIAELGYRGSDKTVRRYLQPVRAAHQQQPSSPVGPSIRQATGWLARHPVRLTEDDRSQLDALLDRSPALVTTHRLVHDFAEIMTERRRSDLAAWMTAVDADGKPALRSFVRGLRRDFDAVAAGLTLPHAPAPSKATSTASRCSKAKCTGEPASIYSANASFTLDNSVPQHNHANCARSIFNERHHRQRGR